MEKSILPPSRRYMPAAVRSKMVLEIASELVGRRGWREVQSKILLRPQGPGPWELTLFGNDAADGVAEIASGESHLAIVNPGAVLTQALMGTGPFKEPVPVRAITVIGSYDQLAFGIHERTGMKSLEDVRDNKYPLKISMRGQTDHTVHNIVAQVLETVGFSIKDLESWGGGVSFDEGLPHPHRVASVIDGTANALFDEAAPQWVNEGIAAGMTICPLEEPVLQKLEAAGFRRGVIEAKDYSNLGHDIQTLDYSGFIVDTHAGTPDDLVTAICEAIEARHEVIPRDQGDGPLPLDRMCQDTPEGPLAVPLHPAAERYWSSRGFL
jgi:TRAP-type uncharacterized transport system substrate-binding protein